MGKMISMALFAVLAFANMWAMAAGLMSVDDVRVDSIVSSHWGQKLDTGYTSVGNPCFNFYTPNGYPCGCCVTPLAQLCRYWKYPASIRAGVSRCLVDGIEVMLEYGGAVYEYEKMPLIAAGADESERAAVGQLTRDWAAALHSMFSNSSTFAFGMFSFVQLQDVFGYKSAVGYVPQNSCKPSPALLNTIIANLDAKCPVVMTVKSSVNNSVHAALVDGYGYNKGKLYFHFNMGWCNARGDDAWYELDKSEGHVSDDETYYFDLIDGLVYNVFPNDSGDILSGRIVDDDGKPQANALVKVACKGREIAFGYTDENGIYSFLLEGGKTYVISSADRAITVPLTASVCAKRRITLTKDGDIWEDPFKPAYNVEGVLGGSSCNDIVIGGTPIQPDEPDFPRSEMGPFNPSKAGKGDYPYCGVIYGDDGNPCGTMTVKFTKQNKQGVSKVSANLKFSDGKSYSMAASPIAVSEVASAKVTGKSVKKLGTIDTLVVGEDGFRAEITKVDGVRLTAISVDLSKGLPQGDYRFWVGGMPHEINGYPVIADQLPMEVGFSINNKGKISLPKPATIKYKKIARTKPPAYELVVDTSKGKTNLLGLKLTYTAKTSSVKGSFNIYTIDEDRHKVNKIAFSVNGMVIDGKVIATAVSKKPVLSLPVTVE